MIKKCILSLVLSLMIVALPVMAAQTPKVILDVENSSIALKWDVSGVYDKLITVTVVDNENDISSDANLPDYAWVDIKPATIYDKKIKLSPKMESGIYYVYTDTATEHHSSSLYVMNINSTETKNVCSDAYSVSSVDAFADSAAYWAPHLGFDMSDEFVSSNFDDAIAPLFYEMNRHTDKTPLSVYNSSRTAIAYAALKNGYDAKQIVAKYAADLDEDNSAFSKITDKVKNKFTYYISKTNNTSESIADVIDKTLVLASLTGAKDWRIMKECALNNASTIGIDISAASAYADIPSEKQYKVFVKLFESLGSVDSFGDFVIKFNLAVTDVLNDLSKGGSTVSGSPSGNSTPSKATVGESFISQATTPVRLFADLGGHFSESYVNELVALGAINGYEDGSFRPNNFVTRAEFVAIAQRALAITASGAVSSFNDVNSGDWYYGAVSAASSNNIISGYNGSFRPNEYITRQDAALILANLMSYRNVTATEAQLTYSDSSSVSEYALSAVAKMASAGIMQGSDGVFRPADCITRGETAAVVARLIKISGMLLEVNN